MTTALIIVTGWCALSVLGVWLYHLARKRDRRIAAETEALAARVAERLRGLHEIVWTFEHDTVRAHVVCHAPRLSDCKIMCPRGCESWGIERDDDGTPYHLSGDERHDMEPIQDDECNVVLFLTENDDPIEELAAERPTFELARVPVEPVWEWDHYLWRPIHTNPEQAGEEAAA